MVVLTLFVKARNAGQLARVQDLLTAEFKDLDVDVKVLGTPVNKWVQVSLSGEDEVLATNYVSKEIGTCPVSTTKIEGHTEVKGYITKVDFTKNEVEVDIGVFEPKITLATIALADLQAQLADGKKIDLKKIADAYGLHENLPLSVKIGDKSLDAALLRAELSTSQIEKISNWRLSLLDRLIVLGSSSDDVQAVLQRTRLDRDIIDVQRLGLFEHALTCKLGTDATGLIPRLGRYMRNAVFVVFSPRRVSGLIGETPLTL